MNRIISLSVEDMYIKYTGEAFGATGSHNAVTLRMTFGPAWEGTAKTAYFTDALGNTSVALVLGLDTLVDGAYEVDVPSEALKAAGVATITIKGVLVSGETTTKAITTAAGHFRVLDSELPDSAGNAGTITPSDKEQLQAEIAGMEALFTTAKAAAEASAANAKVSETNAKASETAAASSASQAQDSAVAAAESAASVDSANKTAQSWAVGGTGTRPGEDTDNAKYWAQQAQTEQTPVSYTPQTLTDAQKAQARANINAAPGGFGLGEGSKFLTSDDDLNEVWENGSYTWDAPPKNAPTEGGSLIPYCSMNVLNKGSDYNTHQIIYTFEGYEIHRYYDGAKKIWSEQAWVNPPMKLGTEYRTTEQRNGKAVYKKLDTDGLLKWRLDGDNTWQIDDGQQVMEIDLSDKVTLSSENLFSSFASIGNEKSVGEKIKQAVLAGRANVTVTLELGEQNPEIVTLPMFGTKGTLKDGTPTYSLTGTYVWAGMLPMDIMIGTIIFENNCTIVKRIESVSSKPLYDPVDKPDETPDGAFLRWSSEQKKWVAEKSPVVIDLYSAGVDIDPSQPGEDLSFDVSTDVVAQFVAAAKNGGALLKFGFKYIQRTPAQAYLVGSAIESMKAYQLSGKIFFLSSGVNVFFSVQLQNNNTSIFSHCTFDQSALPDPETADDGAFLRVASGKWVASNVPSAEGGTF